MQEEDWNTGFDPYDVLLQCQHNIQQCALAINTGSELMKEMGAKFQHQQEVIQQLMFQNRKLQQMLEVLKNQLVQQGQDIEQLKNLK